MSLDQALEWLAHAVEWLSQAFALARGIFSALPDWAAVVAVAFLAAFVGILMGLRFGRKASPAPVAKAAPSIAEPPLAARAAPMEPAPPETPPPVPEPEPEPDPDVAAANALRAVLKDKGVAGKDLENKVADFAKKLPELRARLANIAPIDPDAVAALENARAALDKGDLAEAIEFLDSVGAIDGDAGTDLRRQADQRLTAAAIARVAAADLWLAQMNHPEAVLLYRKAAETTPEVRRDLIAEHLNKLGTAAYQGGDLKTATETFEESLYVLERHLGKEHADVATALNNLGLLYYSQGNVEAAEPLYRRALAIDEKVLGTDAPGVATDLNNLALLFKKKGDLKAAEPLLRRALQIKQGAYPAGHPSLLTGVRNYVGLLRALGDNERADKVESRAALLTGESPPKARPKPAAS